LLLLLLQCGLPHKFIRNPAWCGTYLITAHCNAQRLIATRQATTNEQQPTTNNKLQIVAAT